ncbi:MAG: DUF1345 domain-containing protein [Rubrivivax sp.]|nr:DUF1345 domain-containing protein [Rubrivivax sp.]
MKQLLVPLRARPRLLLSMALGVAVALALPATQTLVTRGLLGWNVAVWLYLLLVGWMMWQADHHQLRKNALVHAEGAAVVLAVVTLAALASLVGIVFELAAAKEPGVPNALQHVMLALATVIGAWFLLPVMFAMTYASLYYRDPQGRGLRFSDEVANGAVATAQPPVQHPDYVDFLYFSFTIAVASQTSDVSVSTRAMRRLVLLQSVLSFAFNTAILAFTINIAASLF